MMRVDSYSGELGRTCGFRCGKQGCVEFHSSSLLLSSSPSLSKEVRSGDVRERFDRGTVLVPGCAVPVSRSTSMSEWALSQVCGGVRPWSGSLLAEVPERELMKEVWVSEGETSPPFVWPVAERRRGSIIGEVRFMSNEGGKAVEMRGPSIRSALPAESRLESATENLRELEWFMLGGVGDGIKPSSEAEKASVDPAGREVLMGCRIRLLVERVRRRVRRRGGEPNSDWGAGFEDAVVKVGTCERCRNAAIWVDELKGVKYFRNDDA